ncbi:MAG: polysaccharide deacetylase family protein [Actinobacteria bacterium]|nr:polysaccharide deacetylase family protein [Actinomycetota bacterium]MBI3687287.1 polysaccharide deacetylase family protein [Actinomycetota bacterium]
MLAAVPGAVLAPRAQGGPPRVAERAHAAVSRTAAPGAEDRSPASRSATAARRAPAPPRRPITNLPAPGRTVVLTFDDGPDPRWTPTVLDLLRQYHARAVFCLVGVHVAEQPALVRRIVREGHLLCDHTWTHDERLPHRSLAVIESEIGRTATELATLTGRRPRYFRAPGGNWAPNVIAVARSGGMAPLGWSVDPTDWARPGSSVIATRVLAAVHPGAVVLMHDGYGRREQSVAALRTILRVLAARGYRFAVPD